jgi:hypothetical protein
MKRTLRINGKDRSVEAPTTCRSCGCCENIIGLTGTKYGCGMALCGACTVHHGRQGDALLRIAHHLGWQPAHYDYRGRRGDPRGRQDPESLARSRGRAVRLLPIRADHVRE